MSISKRLWLVLCLGVVFFLWHTLSSVTLSFSRTSIVNASLSLPKTAWNARLHAHTDVRKLFRTSKIVFTDTALTEVQTPVGHSEEVSQLVLRYTACGGLFNQQYSHVAGLLLGELLKADAIVLPPALSRSSFSQNYTLDAEDQLTWQAFPLAGVLNVAQIEQVWAERGVHICQAPNLLPVPKLSKSDTFFPNYTLPVVSPLQRAQLGDVWLKHLAPDQLVQAGQREVQGARDRLAALGIHLLQGRQPSSLQAGGPTQPGEVGGGGGITQPRGCCCPRLSRSTVVLDLPCTFFAINTTSILGQASRVAASLDFSPAMHALADRVMRGMAYKWGQTFNGLHLRLEVDASAWVNMFGGLEAYLAMHLEAMRKLGFDGGTPLYLASGLLTYAEGSEQWRDVLRWIKGSDVSSTVLIKEEFLGPDVLDGISPEQQGVIDFLVLAKSRLFVGLGASTFSHYLREYRGFKHGLPLNTSVLIHEDDGPAWDTLKAAAKLSTQHLHA